MSNWFMRRRGCTRCFCWNRRRNRARLAGSRRKADRLAASEQQLRDLERDAAELEIARKDHAWFVAALRDFAKVWVNMSPDNQGRFLRALIDKVVVDEDKGTCRVELIDFGAASGTKEAA